MKSIYTKIPYYAFHPGWNEMHEWMSEHVGKKNKEWETYAIGGYTEIIVWDNNKAPLVALRWAR